MYPILCDPIGLQHTRLPCPSPTPRACSNSCLLSWRCHSILCHPLLLLPSICQHRGCHIRWPKYWSFSFSISPSNEHLGLTSFTIDWFDLLTAQGTLKTLLQHYSSKTSILWCSAFFMIQLSHPYTTTGKTIDLTRQTFVGKVMSLLLNMLSRLVHSFSSKEQVF